MSMLQDVCGSINGGLLIYGSQCKYSTVSQFYIKLYIGTENKVSSQGGLNWWREVGSVVEECFENLVQFWVRFVAGDYLKKWFSVVDETVRLEKFVLPF